MRLPGRINGLGGIDNIDIVGTILAEVSAMQLALLWGVVIGAAVLRAFTGFGFGLAAVPVFSLIMAPTQAVVLSTSLTLTISLLTLRTFWGQYPLKALLPMLAFALVGTIAGVILLGGLSARQFQLAIGLIVILACLVLTLYRPRQHEPGAGVNGVTGLASGLMNGAFAIPGPPVIIYAMATQADPARSRSLLMTFFLFSSVLALTGYGAAGFMTPASPWLFVATFPAMYLGDKLGYFLFQRFGAALYRRVALVVLFTIGVVTMMRALL